MTNQSKDAGPAPSKESKIITIAKFGDPFSPETDWEYIWHVNVMS